MLNAYLYAWLQPNSIARGLKNSITIVFHTPKELKWLEKSLNADIILVTPDNFSPLATQEASCRICSVGKWILISVFMCNVLS